MFSIINDFFNKSNFPWENKMQFFFNGATNFTRKNEFSGIQLHANKM